MTAVKIYQEDHESTFSNNGKIHDLNYILAHTHKEPIVRIKVDKVKWQLEYMPDELTDEDEKRIAAADLSVPGLVIKYKHQGQNKILIVDGYHRLRKALREDVEELPYRYVPDNVMEDSVIGTYTPKKGKKNSPSTKRQAW